MRASTQISSIAPTVYNAFFNGDSFRQSVNGLLFCICSITLLFFGYDINTRAVLKCAQNKIDGCKCHIKLTRAAIPDKMIKPPEILLTHLSPPASSFFLKSVAT